MICELCKRICLFINLEARELQIKKRWSEKKGYSTLADEQLEAMA